MIIDSCVDVRPVCEDAHRDTREHGLIRRLLAALAGVSRIRQANQKKSHSENKTPEKLKPAIEFSVHFMPSRCTIARVSLFDALEHEWHGRARLFPSALDGRPLRIELAIVGARTVVYFEMQVQPVERNRIDEKVSSVSVEDVGSSDELLVVRIRPNMYSQLKRPFLRN